MDQFQVDQINRLIANIDANLFSLKRIVRQLNPPTQTQDDGVGDLPPFPPRTPLPSPRQQIQPLPQDNTALASALPTSPAYPVETRLPPLQPVPGAAPIRNQSFPAQPALDQDPFPQVPQRLSQQPPLPQQVTQPPFRSQQMPQPLQEVDPATAPGVEGVFDGVFLVPTDGEKIEVPAAYASKTRILYGDTIKMYDDNGEKKFKVMVKQSRKKLNAMATKRDGKWYALTGLGAYKISDSYAEFNKLGVNDQLTILVPEGNLLVPFAAVEEVIKPEETPKVVEKSQNQTNADKKNSKMVEEYDLV